MAEGSATSKTVICPGPDVRGEGELLLVDFNSMMKTSKVGKRLESDPFMVGDASFAILVYPNGFIGNEGKVCVALGNQNDEDIAVRRCKITVGEDSIVDGEDGIVAGEDGIVVPAKTSLCRDWFDTQDDCRAALQDGNLRVKMEVELPGNEVVLDMDPGDGKISGNNWLLMNLFKRRSESDFSLICEGQAVPVHSQVLAGASPFFEGLLKPRWGGKEKDGIEIDCMPEVGEAVVKFLYTDEIEEAMLDENLTAFLKIASFTMMEELMLRLELRMIQLLNRKNMISFFLAGEKFHGQRIREKAKKFLRANLKWLRGQIGWKEAFGAKKDLIIEILE